MLSLTGGACITSVTKLGVRSVSHKRVLIKVNFNYPSLIFGLCQSPIFDAWFSLVDRYPLSIRRQLLYPILV